MIKLFGLQNYIFLFINPNILSYFNHYVNKIKLDCIVGIAVGSRCRRPDCTRSKNVQEANANLAEGGTVGTTASTTYESPTISPSTTSMRSACGLFGKPGIRMIGPAMTTIISAPMLSVMSRTCNSKPSVGP